MPKCVTATVKSNGVVELAEDLNPPPCPEFTLMNGSEWDMVNTINEMALFDPEFFQAITSGGFWAITIGLGGGWLYKSIRSGF